MKPERIFAAWDVIEAHNTDPLGSVYKLAMDDMIRRCNTTDPAAELLLWISAQVAEFIAAAFGPDIDGQVARSFVTGLISSFQPEQVHF